MKKYCVIHTNPIVSNPELDKLGFVVWKNAKEVNTKVLLEQDYDVYVFYLRGPFSAGHVFGIIGFLKATGKEIVVIYNGEDYDIGIDGIKLYKDIEDYIKTLKVVENESGDLPLAKRLIYGLSYALLEAIDVSKYVDEEGNIELYLKKESADEMHSIWGVKVEELDDSNIIRVFYNCKKKDQYVKRSKNKTTDRNS